MEPLRAALFDLDGTLVDNMRFHAAAWVQVSRELGCERPQAFFETETAGKKNVEILQQLGFGDDPARCAEIGLRKEALYREAYRPRLAPVAGALAFLERLQAAGIPCAVATLAPQANRDMVLDGLGLRRFFRHVIGAEQSPRGKPHPDIYLAAAAALGVAPRACAAFEDAVNGVQSAVAAGMDTLALTTANTEAPLREAGARWIAPDFTRLPAELEARLFAPLA